MKLLKTFAPTFLLLLFCITSCNIEPYEDGVLDDDIANTTCEESIESIATAALNLIAATESNYTEICSVYKVALRNQIEICGDKDGAIQLIINSLDCNVIDQEIDCESINVVVNEAKQAFDLANDLSYTDRCIAYRAALQSKIAICGDVDGSIQTIINGLGDCAKDIIGNTGVYEFMTANINEVEFNNLKPYLYPITFGSSALGFSNDNDETYIQIQGNSAFQSIPLPSAAKEINLFIPESNWKQGTFNLVVDISDTGDPGGITSHYTFINGIVSDVETEILPGKITISKFDLVERVIQGTFEFEYKTIDKNDVIAGPLKVTGTFDYPLDDEFFD